NLARVRTMLRRFLALAPQGEAAVAPDTERLTTEAAAVAAPAKLVRQFRQHFVWPLQLMPAAEGSGIQKHWECLATPAPDNPWSEVADEITGDPRQFAERHYREFVAFLPYVQ